MRRILLLAALTVGATTLAQGAGVVTRAAAGTGSLADARAATAAFHDPVAAIAAGYLPTDVCVEAPGLGVMGEHWVNPALFTTDPSTLDARHPQALLYMPTADGPELIAVEYIVFAPEKEPVGDTYVDPNGPQLFGQHFQGPMAGHEPGMPTHYDLHVWIWRHNPSGTFAQLNPSPAVGC
jgi:hypothetical protein